MVCAFQCFSLRTCASGKYLFQQPERGKTAASPHPQVQPVMRLNVYSQLTHTEHKYTAQDTPIYSAGHTDHVQTHRPLTPTLTPPPASSCSLLLLRRTEVHIYTSTRWSPPAGGLGVSSSCSWILVSPVTAIWTCKLSKLQPHSCCWYRAGTHHTYRARAVVDSPGPYSRLPMLLSLETSSHSPSRGGPQRPPNPSLLPDPFNYSLTHLHYLCQQSHPHSLQLLHHSQPPLPPYT